jgi:hypothetical protein
MTASEPFALGSLHRDPHQLAADTAVLVRRAHGQRPEQMAGNAASHHRRHPDRCDRLAIIGADEGQRQVVRSLLANAGSGTCMPAGAECFFVDVFDCSVVRRVLSEVDQIVLVHDETETG